MEQYKKELKNSCRITAFFCVILAVFSVLGFAAEAGLVELTPVTGDSHWQSTWRGIVSGASMGILALMIFSVVQSLRAIKDEKKLRKLYVEANDERQIKIWTSARALAMQIFLMAGLVAGVAAGYFNMTVSVTILACVLVHSLMGVACKIYYSLKY